MEGKNEKSSSESEIQKRLKTELAGAHNAPRSPTPEATVDPPAKPLGKNAVLATLLRSVEADEEAWPRRALEAVLAARRQMPRYGWQVAHGEFCRRFDSSMSSQEFVRRAKLALVSAAGRRCSTRKFRRDASDRPKPLDEIFEENTLLEVKIMNSIEVKFKECLARLKTSPIELDEWTPKVFSASLDERVLGLLDKVVDKAVREHPPSSMTDMAKIIQAAQQAYRAETERPKRASPWRASIEAKISRIEESRKLLEKARAHRPLKEAERKTAMREMGALGLVLSKNRDLDAGIQRLREAESIYRRKLEVSDTRHEYRAQNRSFELYRNAFYRTLSEGAKVEHSVPVEDIRGFWDTMWNASDLCTPTDTANRPASIPSTLDGSSAAEDNALNASTPESNLAGGFPTTADTPQPPPPSNTASPSQQEAPDYSEFLLEYHPGDTPQKVFVSFKEFVDIVSWLSNWKAPGPDGIYNFYIKKLPSLHKPLYDLIWGICLGGERQDEWFYTGRTSLLPKGDCPKSGADFRPITCMSNLYKLTTKCVTRVLQEIVERRGLLSANQLGTVRFVEGAKEQVFVVKAVCDIYNHKLHTSWVDVAKAYDSVDHRYLRKCLAALDLPEWIPKMIGGLTERWKIKLCDRRQPIMLKEIRRGILQGDSLSPLLFVLCMDPLSRHLNSQFPQLEVESEAGVHVTNHLLFIDDLKVYAEDGDTLKKMMEETERFLDVVGLRINISKSATNSPNCVEKAKLLDETAGYKYLGIMQDKENRLTKETFSKVKDAILARAEALCKTKLNGRNMIQALNEYAISKINYYTGIIDLDPAEFERVDHDIRQTLIKHGLHLQPACKERLYLPRSELGRGLHNIVHRSECMLFQFYKKLEMQKLTSTRRGAILKMETRARTNLSLIVLALKAKYALEEVTLDTVKNAQKNALYNEIRTRQLHQKLYSVRDNTIVSIEDSTKWLRKGNIGARDEANLCSLQDRNVFMGVEAQCPRCGQAKRSVDHMATRCESMLTHDYTVRHNEVVRCIHLAMCNKYGLKNTKRLKGHSVQETIAGKEAIIVVDTRVKTTTNIKHNRPDIIVHDKKRREILMIEVGITSQDRLQTVETEKWRKYDELANEMSSRHKCPVKIVPFVLTWDGIVTKYHRRHISILGLPPKVEAYIQYVVLKKTLESVSFMHRRGLDDLEDAVGASRRPSSVMTDESSGAAEVVASGSE